MSLFPEKQFWSIFIKKWIGFFCSLKVLFFLTATLLLLENKITGSNWVTAIGIIIGARFGNQLMYEYKNGNHSTKQTFSEEEGV